MNVNQAELFFSYLVCLYARVIADMNINLNETLHLNGIKERSSPVVLCSLQLAFKIKHISESLDLLCSCR